MCEFHAIGGGQTMNITLSVDERVAESAREAARKMGKSRCFIDTHILVYDDSTDEPHKQRIAIDLLRHLRFQRLGVLSTQVLNEYIQVGLRKMGLPHSHVRAQLQCYRQMDLAGVTPDTIEQPR
jgi:predicted nucleic acid-binding protein